MAATELTVQTMGREDGDNVIDFDADDVAANADGNYFDNRSGRVWIYAANAGVSSITISVEITQDVDGEIPDPKEIVVGAGKRVGFGGFNPADYNDEDGYVNLTYSAVTDLTVAAVKLQTS